MAKTKGIYRLSNIYWIAYSNEHGETIRESTGTKKYNKARETLDDKRTEITKIKKGLKPATRKIENHTFHELSEGHLSWAQSQKAYLKKAYLVNKLVKRFGQKYLRTFDTKTLDQYKTELIQKNLKPATINHHIGTIKSMFVKAVEWYMIEEYGLKDLRKCEQLKTSNRRLRYLSKTECQE